MNRKRAVLRLLVVVSVLGAASIVSLAASAQTPLLTGEGTSAQFPPCIAPGGAPPPIGTCTNTAPAVTASCDPAGTSTISFTKSGYALAGPYQGTFTETVTATLGPQDGPPASAFQPFSWSGAQVGSIGFPTGRILSFDATFTITGYDGTTITGTKSLTTDLANTGVCVEFDHEQPPSNVFGAPMSGYFYILNAQVLSYTATVTSGSGSVPDSGPAEAYLMNSFGTFDYDGSVAATSTGSYDSGFGTTHPATGTTTSAPTPAGTDVLVAPAPGVAVTFGDVTVGGTTSVTQVQQVPALPSGFQAGDPPTFYDLSTTATFSGTASVCVPYGSPPAGTTPRLLHYDNGSWVDVTTSFDATTQIVCGSVSSFSPFAAVFQTNGPSTAADCKHGGWKQYGNPSFKNQGDCVSYVATKGNNGPNG
jgi:hypothetical protein